MITLSDMSAEEKRLHRKAQLAAAQRRYRERHSGKIAAARRATAKTERHQAWKREYYARPDVRERERARQREAKKTPTARKKNAEWQRNRRKNSPMRILSHRMSSLINFHIKAGKGGRSWKALVPYTPDQLMVHLQRQFLRGMTWENIGDWQIDHIIPVSLFSFDSVNDPEFQRCWGLPNLRPLWRKDNHAKLNRRTHLL